MGKVIDEKLAVWALSSIDGIGPAGFRRLIEKFGSATAVFAATFNSIMETEAANPAIGREIIGPWDWDDLKARHEKTIPGGARFVAFTDTEYPERLRNIHDPPPYLYCKGTLEILEYPALSVVGSRAPSDYGIRMTSKIVGDLAAAGVVIISGLAYGIDGAAHQAALECGGITAAVFGCGLDVVYPSGHRGLAERICMSGCLLSEFPKGTRPERFNFPIRNRIVSGLSEGVLVVEAGEKSGALVTASIALEQGRDVLAVPGSVDSKLSFGPNSLIKQGAIAVTSADDIFDNFGWHRSAAATKPQYDLGKLSKDEIAVFNQISVQPVHLDEIGRKTELGPSRTAEVLLNLELKGLIMRKPGNYVVKA